MKYIELFLCSGGLEDPFFTDKIAITVNRSTICKSCYNWDQISKNVVSIDDFLKLLINSSIINSHDEFDSSRERCYIFKNNMLYYANSNKTIVELFEFVGSDSLSLYIFYIGGASINIENKYKLMIHTNEDVHKNMPHVHVVKGNDNVRYLLKSLERVKTDKCSRNIIRDEKKIIIPGIRKNLVDLWDMWKSYNSGYIPPVIDFDGIQYYSES